MTEPAWNPLPLTKTSDGPISLLINRRVSARFSGPMARAGFTPNHATAISLAIGIAGAAGYALGIWWLGGVLMQFSSIFAGVDGEIARRTGRSSLYGDFFDTVADRLVEYLGLAAVAYGLAQTDRWEDWAWPLGVLALGATFMLASASEKYRSVTHENYPKRLYEPLFAYLVSGRDVRVFYFALLSLAATWNVDILFWGLAAITALMHVNFLYRVVIVRDKLGA